MGIRSQESDHETPVQFFSFAVGSRDVVRMYLLCLARPQERCPCAF